MDPPSTADIKGWTELPALKTASASRADRLVAIAISTFKRITGINLSTVAADDVPIIQHAITGLAEMLTFQTDPEYLESLADFDLIQSFNAGPYSETRRSPDEARKARMLVAWPWLSDLLWSLLTDDKRDFWFSYFTDQRPPAFEVQEVDWSSGERELGGSYRSDSYRADIWGA